VLSFLKDRQTYFYLLLLVSVGIGLQSVIYKVAIIGLLLQWIIQGEYKQKLTGVVKNNLAASLIGLYFFLAISFFWSENKIVAITDAMLKLPLVIFPLVILSQKRLSAKEINQVFLAFALSSCLLNLFCMWDAVSSFINTGKINEFYYYNLTINMHTAYQAMFTSFSIVIFFYLFIEENVISNWLAYFAIAIQVIFVFLLSSRMQILIMMVILPTFFIGYYYKRKKPVIGLLYALFLFVFSYLIITIPSALNYRYKQTISQIKSVGGDSSDPRNFIWTAGLQVVKKNFLIGAGSGDAKDLLLDEYSQAIIENPLADTLVDSMVSKMKKRNKIVSYFKKKSSNNNITFEKKLTDYARNILGKKNKNYKNALKKEYNFHNQYFQIFAVIGFFGLILFCYLLFTPFVLSIRNKDYFFALFLFIVGFSFLTESMLERQAGTSFFPFFYVIFLSVINQNKLS